MARSSLSSKFLQKLNLVAGFHYMALISWRSDARKGRLSWEAEKAGGVHRLIIGNRNWTDRRTNYTPLNGKSIFQRASGCLTRDATSGEPSKTKLKSSIQSRRKNACLNDLGYRRVLVKIGYFFRTVDYIARKKERTGWLEYRKFAIIGIGRIILIEIKYKLSQILRTIKLPWFANDH